MHIFSALCRHAMLFHHRDTNSWVAWNIILSKSQSYTQISINIPARPGRICCCCCGFCMLAVSNGDAFHKNKRVACFLYYIYTMCFFLSLLTFHVQLLFPFSDGVRYSYSVVVCCTFFFSFICTLSLANYLLYFICQNYHIELWRIAFFDGCC